MSYIRPPPVPIILGMPRLNPLGDDKPPKKVYMIQQLKVEACGMRGRVEVCREMYDLLRRGEARMLRLERANAKRVVLVERRSEVEVELVVVVVVRGEVRNRSGSRRENA